MNMIEALNWRYATKKFDSSKLLDIEAVEQIIEAARLAPTSSGLQPFELFVITNQDLKQRIVTVSYGQQMPAECSHLLVFAAWNRYTDERIDHIYNLTTRERNMPLEKYDAYKERLKSGFAAKTDEQNWIHASKQAYIALGFALAQAAMLGVDSVPMEGFDATELDKLLNLNEKGLRSVLMLPLGYRDEKNDWLMKLKKVRHPKEEFVHYIV